MRKQAEAGAGGSQSATGALNPGVAEFPLASAVVTRVMSIVNGRVARRRWSPRRTLAFITLSSLLLWALIITGGLWLAGALRGQG